MKKSNSQEIVSCSFEINY